MATNKELIITSKNIEELFESNPNLWAGCDIIYVESGDDFQEYHYEDGSRVPHETPIGYEKDGVLYLASNIYFP